ncbi:hypothetical protein AVEN_96795-1 [Araneus ventricosus]|uniref:Uncharacterized protein n=1 Tax=Araneus ventricosus TaxID=182803 RepID=A0A4Y2N9N2_ARAVE|nr:hypothetical protein AVEN_265663-1 [Araneus ventricosus]GBN35672.1 hypothetical protein AVEN_96795-1 [Araneus ventricosus]
MWSTKFNGRSARLRGGLVKLRIDQFSFSASPEFMHPRPTIKSLTFDRQSSWTVFKTRFDVVSSTNGWTDFVKASQLVASLRGSAAEVLQGIPADKLTDLTTIEKALESRFGDSHLRQFYRTELKTRRQKPGESLQVLAVDVERLMSLAYAECPLDVLESLAVQFFVDAIRDEETAVIARKVKERLIYTAPNLILKTVTGEKAKIQGKLDASIECGSRKFQHRVYVADITVSCILGLDFLQKFKFTVDLEKNEIRTGSEKISLFSGSTQHRKRTSDGKNVLSRRLCFEGCEPCSNAEKKFRMETHISVEALTMTTENRCSLSEIQKAQLEDPDIRPILKMKLNSADRPSWQEIARESPATKRYWVLWNFLYLKDGVLYRKWESNDGGFYRRQLILSNCRIQEVLRDTQDNTSGKTFWSHENFA